MIGQVLYGMHFEPGVAEYREKGKDPFRVFISEKTAKQMDATFPGRPMFVDHVNEVTDRAPDGYVVESFFNELDGKHWSKFIITTDRKSTRLNSSHLGISYAVFCL